jgi:hypothetical protein
MSADIASVTHFTRTEALLLAAVRECATLVGRPADASGDRAGGSGDQAGGSGDRARWNAAVAEAIYGRRAAIFRPIETATWSSSSAASVVAK